MGTPSATAEVSADSGGVPKPPRVTAARLFSWMCEGAVSPVMAPAAGTPPDLEFIHPEMIGSVGIAIGPAFVIITGIIVVGREEFVEVGFIREIGVKAARRGIRGRRGGEKELPWRDFEQILDGLVGREEIVMLGANGAHFISFFGVWEEGKLRRKMGALRESGAEGGKDI